jgi:hypothetical protein
MKKSVPHKSKVTGRFRWTGGMTQYSFYLTLMLPKPAVFSLLILTTACGPLVPIAHVDRSTDHQLTQSIETTEATVWIRYIQSQDGYMVFDLEIANQSRYEMPVAPQQISFYASSKPFAPIQTGDEVHILSARNSTLTMTRQFANDPASIQRLYVEKARSQKVGAGIFAALTVGLILFDMAEDSKDSRKEVFTSRDAQKSFGRDVMVTTAAVASDIARSSAQHTAEESHFLPYELFPESIIEPGTSARGKIFLPRESSHKYVRVIVPLSDADYVFDFKRRGVKK